MAKYNEAAAGGPPPPPAAAANNGDHNNHNHHLPAKAPAAHWLDLAGHPPSRDVLLLLARSGSMTSDDDDDEALAYLRAVAQHLRAGGAATVPQVLQVRVCVCVVLVSLFRWIVCCGFLLLKQVKRL